MNYWRFREELREKAKKHTEEMNRVYGEEIGKAIVQSDVWSREENGKCSAKRYSDTDSRIFKCIDEEKDTFIEVIRATSDEAIFKSNADNIVVLNFASYKNPGGMFLDGSCAQEESLCHHSFLYNVLQNFGEYYGWNSVHLNKGMYRDRAIFTPNVRFFSENESKLASVLTCAAPNKRFLEKSNFNEEENRKALESRTEFLKEIIECELSKADGSTEFIVGAWGCGVFRQDTREVITILKNEFRKACVDKVTFAIPDEGKFELAKMIV